MKLSVILVCVFILKLHETDGSSISSCPSYGCRPSGTFSVLLKLPSLQPKVIWNTTYGPIPNCLGCVGNINNIICPYQGLRLNGYVSIDGQTGKQVWYDGVLHHPSLPVMDIQGDIIGTDGRNLVKYEADGTQVKPSIPINPSLYPLYSVQLSDNGFLLFASKAGIIFAYDTVGIPLGAISLNGSIQMVNGTFIPVTTPIIVGSRVYVLTEFKADYVDPMEPNILGMRRLYAVDIFARMADRLHITWVFDFEMEQKSRMEKTNRSVPNGHTFSFDANQKQSSVNTGFENVLKFKPHLHIVEGEPLIMADSQRQNIYVILPAPENDVDSGRMFWAIKDNGDNQTLLYKQSISASRMAMYEVNGSLKKHPINPHNYKKNRKSPLLEKIVKKQNIHDKKDDGIPVWLLAQSKNLVYKVLPMDGSIAVTLNLTSMFGGQVDVTSDIMICREDDNQADSIIFGVSVKKSSTQNFLVSISENGNIQWMVATPSNAAVIGQIAGISDEGSDSDNMFVAFGTAEESHLSVVFGVQ